MMIDCRVSEVGKRKLFELAHGSLHRDRTRCDLREELTQPFLIHAETLAPFFLGTAMR
jgi:hypothetical protein